MSRYSEARDRQRAMVKQYEHAAATALIERAATMRDPGAMMAAGGGGAMAAFGDSGRRGQAQAKTGLAVFRGHVYTCVNAIAKRLAAQPLLAGTYVAPQSTQGTGSGRSRARPTAGIISKASEPPLSRGFYVAKQHAEKAAILGQQVEVLDNHPLLDVLARPNPIQRKWEFLYFLAANMLLTGQAYIVGGVIEGEDDDAGDYRGGPAIQLWALPTSWIQPRNEGNLHTGYDITFPGAQEPVPVDKECVRRIYFPDPSDPRNAMSPLEAIMTTVRTDEAMTRSQEAAFERGLNPNVMITVGKVRNPDGTVQDRRPVLTPAQRRAIIRAVREMWRNSVGNGDPAILDGFIENIHKLQMTPREMDWINSGKITKDRIYQAYNVNPITVGEVTPSNKAQAVEAEKNLCGMALNPIGEAISDALTDFVQGVYAEQQPAGGRPAPGRGQQKQEANICVWVEPCIPLDREQRLAEWTAARKAMDVSRNEFRTEILGLPPVEEERPRSTLLETVGGVTGAVSVMQARGSGLVAPEQAQAIFEIFYGLDEDAAKRLAGEATEPPEPPEPKPPGQTPPPEPEEEGEEEEEPEEPEAGGEEEDTSEIEPGEESEAAYRLTASEAELAMAGELRKAYGERGITLRRKDVAELHTKQANRVEGVIGRELARFFGQGIAEAAKKLSGLPDSEASVPPGSSAGTRAEQITRRIWDRDRQDERLYRMMIPHLLWAIAEGALAEQLLRVIGEAKRHRRWATKTTAEDAVQRYGLELPEGIDLRLPDWLLREAQAAIRETFQQHYWQDINETTRDAIRQVIENGIEEGRSIRALSDEIQGRFGSEYTRWRATNVARTETTGAMNRGHRIAISQTAEETGLPIGKEWVSVLGPTTRPDHAAADAQQVATADGMFNVGGHETPEPGHWSLPPEQRCQCQCTLISSFTVEDLEEELDEQEAEGEGGDALPGEGIPEDGDKPAEGEELADIPVVGTEADLIDAALERLEQLRADASDNYAQAPFEAVPDKKAPKLDEVHDARNWYYQGGRSLTDMPKEQIALEKVLLPEHATWQSKRDIEAAIRNPRLFEGRETSPRDGWPQDGPVVIRMGGKLYAHREAEYLTAMALREEKAVVSYVLDLDKWRAERWTNEARLGATDIMTIVREHPEIQKAYKDFSKFIKTPAAAAYRQATTARDAARKAYETADKEAKAAMRAAAKKGLSIEERREAELKFRTLRDKATEAHAAYKLREQQTESRGSLIRTEAHKALQATTKNVADGWEPAAMKVTFDTQSRARAISDEGARAETGKWTPAAKERAQDAVKFVNSVTATLQKTPDGRRDMNDLPYFIGDEKLRAFYYKGGHNAAADKFQRGVHISPYDTTDVHVHEIGHHLEYHKGATGYVNARSSQFVRARIEEAKTPDINMKQEFGGGYAGDETGNEDHFTKVFDKHSAAYTGKTYQDGATELVSMGLQKLYEDPVGFADKDPDYFKFMIGFLRGHIR